MPSVSDTSINTIAVHCPGEMGHAIGRELKNGGFDVVAYLGGRSERTRRLAGSAGIRDCESLESLVEQADLILSILVPSSAAKAAESVAAAVRRTACQLHYADCNAVSPRVVSGIAADMMSTGASFTDASIIGLPPGPKERPRVYVSGPHASALSVLDGCGVEIVQLGRQIGQASAIKMCYAGLTKGRFALYFAVLMAAQRMDLLPQLLSEFEQSQPDDHHKMERVLPKLPCKAHRWVGEMQQIAESLSDLELPPQFHIAAAEIYELISGTPLGAESPEDIDPTRTLEATLSILETSAGRANGERDEARGDSSH